MGTKMNSDLLERFMDLILLFYTIRSRRFFSHEVLHFNENMVNEILLSIYGVWMDSRIRMIPR